MSIIHIVCIYIKFIIVFPGGINETIGRIIQQCREQEIPVIYALSRRQLAYVLKKKFHIGCVGIISYAGAEVRLSTALGCLLIHVWIIL